MCVVFLTLYSVFGYPDETLSVVFDIDYIKIFNSLIRVPSTFLHRLHHVYTLQLSYSFKCSAKAKMTGKALSTLSKLKCSVDIYIFLSSMAPQPDPSMCRKRKRRTERGKGRPGNHTREL